ncbi:MAG: hypothetical protein QF893_01690 [Alphaproteobacteria bacterium]|jgi:hypothetical protein|nr:hypothetical protein [Alphaproteobacteria bacterium]
MTADGGALYVIVLLFGAAVGFAELIARYRDAPQKAIWTPAAFVYITINGLAAAAALAVIQANGWTFGASGEAAIAVRQVLVAGFGAMAFFRSGLFSVRVGDGDVQIGPGAFLQIVLNAADRAVDRARAEPRAEVVADVMTDVTFEKASEALPDHCLYLMQSVSAEERDRLEQEISRIAVSGKSDKVKSYNLGLLLMNLVGEPVLRAAVAALGDQITGSDTDAADRAHIIDELMGDVSFDRAQLALPTHCFALHANVPAEQQEEVAAIVEMLNEMALDDSIKALQLGIALLDLVGEKVLRAAVVTLGDRIRR